MSGDTIYPDYTSTIKISLPTNHKCLFGKHLKKYLRFSRAEKRFRKRTKVKKIILRKILRPGTVGLSFII